MPMNPRLLRPTGQFDPRRIANLAYWLDASDSSTVTTVSGAVSSWASKVGAGNATQGNAANRPAYTTAGRNGRNVVTFDGSNDKLITSTLSINQPFTIVWTGNSTGPAPSASPAAGPYVCDGIVTGGTSPNFTSNNRVAIAWNATAATANNGRLFAFAGSVIEPAAGATAYNAWSVVSAVFDGSSSRVRADGAQVVSGNPGATNIGALTLGDRFLNNVSPNTGFNGPWGAFLIYSRALSDDECLRVERYLGNLFAVTIP